MTHERIAELRELLRRATPGLMHYCYGGEPKLLGLGGKLFADFSGNPNDSDLVLTKVLHDHAAELLSLAKEALDARKQSRKVLMPSDAKKLLKIPVAARRLNISEKSAYKLAREGKLPTVQVGSRSMRVDPDALEAWIAAGAERTAGKEQRR